MGLGAYKIMKIKGFWAVVAGWRLSGQRGDYKIKSESFFNRHYQATFVKQLSSFNEQKVLTNIRSYNFDLLTEE